ncbi:MAG: DUF3021 domain-containing protein [Clostridia bacterium]
MKKKLIFRCLIGAPLGLALSTLITVLISLTVADGNYYAVVPALIEDCGSELNAVLLQTVCSLLYGAAWAGASLIWEKENRSLLWQTTIHFIVCSAATFPIAYITQWMEHSLWGVLSYFAIFFGIYLMIWIAQYTAIWIRLQKMNTRMREKTFEP